MKRIMIAILAISAIQADIFAAKRGIEDVGGSEGASGTSSSIKKGKIMPSKEMLAAIQRDVFNSFMESNGVLSAGEALRSYILLLENMTSFELAGPEGMSFIQDLNSMFNTVELANAADQATTRCTVACSEISRRVSTAKFKKEEIVAELAAQETLIAQAYRLFTWTDKRVTLRSDLQNASAEHASLDAELKHSKASLKETAELFNACYKLIGLLDGFAKKCEILAARVLREQQDAQYEACLAIDEARAKSKKAEALRLEGEVLQAKANEEAKRFQRTREGRAANAAKLAPGN